MVNKPQNTIEYLVATVGDDTQGEGGKLRNGVDAFDAVCNGLKNRGKRWDSNLGCWPL